MDGEISNAELKEIIEVIKAQYGYDFSEYSAASLKRRFVRFAGLAKITPFELKYNIINDKQFFSWLLQSITVNVTEMFRDPAVYKHLNEQVFPVLSTYPIIKIWHAGCSTGEEAFSIAILLQEAGLLDRTKIYATDLNPQNLEKANSGIISLPLMKDYTLNYIRAGGRSDFSSYYTAMYDNAIINKEIRNAILFSQHNLVTDFVFNEFNLICCRNVLIYFNKELQNRVINLFYQSLAPLGYLTLGIKETLLFTDCKNKFEEISAQNKIFRLKNEAE